MRALRRRAAPSRARRPGRLPDLRRGGPSAAGLAEHLRPVRPQRRPARAAAAPARSSSSRAPTATAPGARSWSARSSRSRSRRASTTASGSAIARRRACGRARRPAGDVLRAASASGPIRASCATATTLLTAVDLTMTEAALGATVTVPTLDGRRRARVPARHAARRGARAARARGCPSLQGSRPRRSRACSSTSPCRGGSTTSSARLLEQFDAELGDEAYAYARRGRGVLRAG